MRIPHAAEASTDGSAEAARATPPVPSNRRRRGQAQIPDIIKLVAVALPILIGLIALYNYYGQALAQEAPVIMGAPGGAQQTP